MPKLYRHKGVQAGHEYALDVDAGRIDAPYYARMAIRRYLRDLKRDWRWTFDEERAAHAIDFQQLLPHVKGKWKTPNITLEPYQHFIYMNIFGWVDKKTRFRRFNTATIWVPRKHGKSLIGSGIALYMLSADNEVGPEVYSAAVSHKQAQIVFKVAKTQARQSPEMCQKLGIEVHAHRLTVQAEAGVFEALSSEASSLDGLNVHCAVLDEIAFHKNRGVYDVIDTAKGSRDQPLICTISTAGWNTAGIGFEVLEMGRNVVTGKTVDERLFSIEYSLDSADKNLWQEPAVWAKCNPALGVSISYDEMENQATKAANQKSRLPAFMTKRLNAWVQSADGWLDMADYDKCGDADLRIEDFKDCRCIIGADLASKLDICSIATVFYWVDPDDETVYYAPFVFNFTNEAAVARSKNAQYKGWQEEGYLFVNKGSTTDQRAVKKKIREINKTYDVEEFAFDPYQAVGLVQDLEDEIETCIEVQQSVRNMNEAMRAYEAALADETLYHDNNPVMRWMAANVETTKDWKDNIFPRKAGGKDSENKIDGIVATLIAMARIIALTDQTSIYDSEDDDDYEEDETEDEEEYDY